MATQQDKYILKVEGLGVNYGNFEAVKDVGFKVLQGEIFEEQNNVSVRP